MYEVNDETTYIVKHFGSFKAVIYHLFQCAEKTANNRESLVSRLKKKHPNNGGLLTRIMKNACSYNLSCHTRR